MPAHMDLYKLHATPEELKHYDAAQTSVPPLIMSKDSNIAFNYAIFVLKTRFPEGERAILANDFIAHRYKVRFGIK